MRKKFENFSSSIFWYGILVLILGVVYVSTLLPGIGYSGDAAKFQFVGRVLGTPHISGYPTYLILNHFFTKLFPIGSLAYKANLLSAIFSIASSLFLFRILKDIFNLEKGIAFTTSLTFGLTPTLWSQSIVAEVYTLHILFVTIVFYFLLRWNKTRKDRDLLIACAFYAFSFGNHLTMITLLLPIVYLVWATDKKVFTDFRKIIWVILFIVAAALQYSYLFWRSHAPYIAYLELTTTNFKTLLWNLCKEQIFPFFLAQVISVPIPMFLKLLLREYLFLIPVSIFGMFKFKNKTITIFLLLCFLGNMSFAINYHIPDIFVYFIPNFLIMAIYLGVGLDSIDILLFKKGFLFQSCLIFLIPVSLLFANYSKVNQHNNTQMAKEIETILKTVKKDAIIFSPDYTYSEYFWYYLIGEGLERNNIYIFHHYQSYTEPIQAYMCEGKPLCLWDERKNVSPGLTVYIYHITADNKAIVEKAGFNLSKMGRDLYKVSVKFF